MKVYYLNDEYEVGKHKIRKVWAEVLGINMPDVPSGCSVLELDELYNRKLAQALVSNNQELLGFPDKLYVDNVGNLCWQDGTLVTTNPNPQKESYKLSQLYGLTQAQLENYIENNVTNLAQAKVFLKKLSAVVLWLVKQTKLDE